MIRSLAIHPNELTRDSPTLTRNLPQEKIEAKLAEGYLFWIDVVDIEPDEIEWLEELFDLHPNIIEDIKRFDKRPTINPYKNYLFLRLIQPTMQGQTVSNHEVYCILGDTYFLTIRPESTKTVDKAYTHASQNMSAWAKGGAYFLFLTIQQVVDVYYPLLDRTSNRISTLEERLLEGKAEKHDPKAIHNIKHELITMRQMVAPQREVLSNLISAERVTSNSNIIDLYRHLYERHLRVYDVIDSLRELSSNVLDMYQSYESKRLVDAVNRLTIFSMIFLPLTFLTGLFELNFVTTADQIVLPISGQIMFFTVTLLMLMSAIGMILLFRRRKWL